MHPLLLLRGSVRCLAYFFGILFLAKLHETVVCESNYRAAIRQSRENVSLINRQVIFLSPLLIHRFYLVEFPYSDICFTIERL